MGKQIKCRRIFNHLPADIIEAILCNLPVKSLLRFKCVSKSWRSSISSRGFIREHLKKSNSGTDFTHHNLFFRFLHSNRISPGSDYSPRRCFTDPNNVGSCCIGSLLNDDDEPTRSNLSTPNPIPTPIPIPALDHKDVIFLLGSCNGLILIRINYMELYLWNPSTRKAKNVLNPPEIALQRGWHHSGYGFGYDESTDDYKLVCIFSSPNPLDQTQTYMYSSRTESWKKIQNFDERSLLGPAKFADGRLHWLTQKSEVGGTSNWDIVSLDLMEEKYQIMAPRPHCFSSYDDDSFSPFLEDLGGYLSLICYYNILNIMDDWVMKNESWSKIGIFSRHPTPTPLWLKKNGDIMVAVGSNFVIHRGKDKLRQSRLHDMLTCDFEPTVYVESLVSPLSDDEQLQQ